MSKEDAGGGEKTSVIVGVRGWMEECGDFRGPDSFRLAYLGVHASQLLQHQIVMYIDRISTVVPKFRSIYNGPWYPTI